MVMASQWAGEVTILVSLGWSGLRFIFLPLQNVVQTNYRGTENILKAPNGGQVG